MQGGVRAVAPGAVRDRRHPLTRGRTPSARPAGALVHHDACRCDGVRKTIPGWEYQFLAAVGHLRTAWTALADVERTLPSPPAPGQTARQVK